VKTIKEVFSKPQYTGLFWLVLRVFVGYEFFTAGLEKVQENVWVGSQAGVGISGFLKGALTKGTGGHPEVQAWFVDLVKNIFLPNAVTMSYMVAFGETLVGLALIFGIVTKWAAFWGAFMNFSFLAAGTSSSNPQMLAIEAALLFGGLGVGYYGIDYFLVPAIRKLLGQPAGATLASPVPVPVPVPVTVR
jgi:thiosulfate dehydrogenase [quinone] large subunit